jgi:threonine dehydrogenase-like Zn-dependent dehydrogenase
MHLGQRVSTWRDPGHGQNGCYAQYVVLKAEYVIPVPAHLPPKATAPLELATCVAGVFTKLDKLDALRGQRVGIMGLGPAGLIALQMARAAGAGQIFGFDLSPARRELALSLGADAVFDSRTDGADQFPVRPAQPLGLDCSIDCVGAKFTVEWLLDRTESVVALFGVQREDFTYTPAHGGGWRGVTLFGYAGNGRAEAAYAAALLESGQLDLAPLVTHELPLEEYGHGVDLLEEQKAVKICFRPFGLT